VLNLGLSDDNQIVVWPRPTSSIQSFSRNTHKPRATDAQFRRYPGKSIQARFKNQSGRALPFFRCVRMGRACLHTNTNARDMVNGGAGNPPAKATGVYTKCGMQAFWIGRARSYRSLRVRGCEGSATCVQVRQHGTHTRRMGWSLGRDQQTCQDDVRASTKAHESYNRAGVLTPKQESTQARQQIW
jgi:hypothetical protein